MFTTFILLPSNDIPEERTTQHETFSAALNDADRLFEKFGGARRLEIWEGSPFGLRAGRLIASLRTVR